VSLFGTDGVRGVAGVDLTADLARKLAAAAAAELVRSHDHPLVAVGRDTRPSGGWLQDAVVDGLRSAGADVALLGVVPSPAVARAVADGLPGGHRPTFGLVVSASHNPASDNGIKLFGPGGLKLDEVSEARIEARLADDLPDVPTGVVRVDRGDDPSWYVDALLATAPARLDGLSVVVDCANGASATVAEAVYAGAGADVRVINVQTSGERINDGCGATHPSALQEAVVGSRARVGIALDGDADRCVAATETGDLLDGDAILAVLALDMQRRDNLRGALVVATVMSNLGLRRALADHGISLVTTPVGDRHVAERMRAEAANLGGEQSGHIVLTDHATTGDGLLTGLHLLAAVAASARPLSELAAVMSRMPQVLVNVRVANPSAASEAVAPVVSAVEAELGDTGRVLVRPSGTEPLVRVMVEAESEARAREVAERIARLVRTA
jgi:phosphoglucosamine mutase